MIEADAYTILRRLREGLNDELTSLLKRRVDLTRTATFLVDRSASLRLYIEAIDVIMVMRKVQHEEV